MVETIPNEMRVINDYRVRGKETPVKNKIREFIRENPNCKISDINKKFPEIDSAHIRRTIRNMVEGHELIQRFSLY